MRCTVFHVNLPKLDTNSPCECWMLPHGSNTSNKTSIRHHSNSTQGSICDTAPPLSLFLQHCHPSQSTNKYSMNAMMIPERHLSPVRMTTATAVPLTRVVPKKPMFSASFELSVRASALLVSGVDSPVSDELSTLTELHQMNRTSAGILSPDLPPARAYE